MGKSRQYFDGRHYKRFDGQKFLEKPVSINRMGQLFEQIKAQEMERKIQQEKKAAGTEEQEEKKEEIADGILDIDESLNKELYMSKRRRKFNMSRIKQCTEDDKSKAAIRDDDSPLYYIANDEKISTLLEYDIILKLFVDMMEKIQGQYTYCSNKLSEYDKKRQDFLHELGQPRKSASEGFKLYDLAHRIEVQRRAYKDAMGILQPLLHLANKEQEMLPKMKEAIEKLEIGKEARENRIYIPRSDLPLSVGDPFRSLTKTEQEKVMKNFENSRRVG